MKRKGLRIIKRIHVFVLLVLAFTLLNTNASFAQQLPKSWMPKWKVGDWWRVKTDEGHYYKYEIIGKENLKGVQGLVIKVTLEGSLERPEDSELFVVDRHLSVRKNFRSGKCMGQKKGYPCGGDEPISAGFKEGYPFAKMGLIVSFPLPAFPIVVGSKKYAPYMQQVRRVTGQELVAKGYNPGGLFKPTGNYYEVTIMFNDTYRNKNEVENTQIWSIDAPYFVYFDNRGSKFWLLESSWKQK